MLYWKVFFTTYIWRKLMKDIPFLRFMEKVCEPVLLPENDKKIKKLAQRTFGVAVGVSPEKIFVKEGILFYYCSCGEKDGVFFYWGREWKPCNGVAIPSKGNSLSFGGINPST
jgi:hypothetical protein